MKKRLFISCTGKKLSQRARALDMYGTRQFKLAKELHHLGWEITIISAKHGLLDSDTLIETYDQKIDQRRSDSILAEVRNHDFSGTKNYVYGGELYRRIIRAVDSEVIEVIGQNRGNGDHYSALKKITEEERYL